MKISAFTFIKNGQILGYPFVQSIKSILPIVDEFVVNVGNSEDDTILEIKSINDKYVDGDLVLIKDGSEYHVGAFNGIFIIKSSKKEVEIALGEPDNITKKVIDNNYIEIYTYKYKTLSKINNELEKLQIILPKGSTITPKHIEENIGFSKDFNNFELQKAVGQRNVLKTHRIINYFAQNPKDNPLVVTTSLVFGFFLQLLQYHGLKDKSQMNAAKVLKVNPYFIKDYEVAFRNYPMKKVSTIVAALREIDVKSKGVGANAIPAGDILKELLFKIIH